MWVNLPEQYMSDWPTIRHKNKKTNTSGRTFNNGICGGLQSLTITPLEILPQQSEGILIPLKELMARRERELYWMNKLKTKAPMGINKRTELPPPTPFVIKFSDQSGKITQLAKTYFTKIKKGTPGPFFTARFLGTTSRNKNLKNILVRTSLKWNSYFIMSDTKTNLSINISVASAMFHEH